jgi:two-component system response regulator PilR (NtrC family)
MTRKILGDSPPVRALLDLIGKVSQARTNVLIIGESGTGKELVARMIHESGPLKGKPFVPINCGAIPETLIESELFGHKKGSFTGAIADKMGLFEVANGGTVFLDEVGELPLSMQVKLLRAIQDRSFRKVGGTDDVRVDVRIIAATNRDLEVAVGKGTFREDLYYRLNVIQIPTPPLRERRGDVGLLAASFLARFGERSGRKLEGFEPDALRALEAYDWPGNVRELENLVERAGTLEAAGRRKISLASLPPSVAGASAAKEAGGSAGAPPAELRVPAPDFAKGALQLDAVLGEVERAYVLAALEHAGGVRKRAAELLSVTSSSLKYRLKKLGIDDAED